MSIVVYLLIRLSYIFLTFPVVLFVSLLPVAFGVTGRGSNLRPTVPRRVFQVLRSYSDLTLGGNLYGEFSVHIRPPVLYCSKLGLKFVDSICLVLKSLAGNISRSGGRVRSPHGCQDSSFQPERRAFDTVC